jgi:hypothetical protein
VPREGGQEGGCGTGGMRHREHRECHTAKQGAEARDWSWVKASVWTDRMVSALVNGVKGGRWFSLSTLAQRLLRSSRVARAAHGLAGREMLPMRKPLTGEPYAGKPPVRFGGRGGR